MTKLRIMCELRQLDHIHGAGEVGLSSVRYMQPIALTSIMHCTFFVLCGHLAKFSWSKPEACSRAVKMLFHSIGHSVRLGPDPRDGHPTLQKLRKKHRILSRMPEHPSPRDKMSPICLGTSESSTNQKVFHGLPFTHFRSHATIIGKGNLFDFTTIFTWLTARSCTGQRGTMKKLDSELNFFWGYEQKMVPVSGNTGTAPLIGSKVIWDRASDRSVWSPWIQGSTQTASVRGGLDARWSKKVP